MRSRASMTTRTALFLFVLLLMALPTGAPAALAPADEEPHDFVRLKRKCGWCHVSVKGKTSRALRKTVGRICAECHIMNETRHPVEIDPAMEIPADLPLDSQGLLTCATCHNIHRPRLNTQTGAKTMYLRRDGAPRAFCEACHRNGVFPIGEANGGK